MSVYKQPAPYSLHLEPVEGCSLACSFCALQAVRDNGADWKTGTHGKNSVPYRFADPAMFDLIGREAVNLGWTNPRVEIDGRGEPTMHPKLPEIIGSLRARLPKAYFLLTTNGSGLIKAGRIDALFKAGLDTLAFDRYQHAAWKDEVSGLLRWYGHEHCVPIYEYPESNEGNPHQRHKGQRIVIIQDISQNHSGTHKVTNQGGNSGARETIEQRCAKPFRDLFIRWDGNVAICCDDWKGQYKIANVNKVGLDGVWHHPRLDAARRMLWRGRRGDIEVCSGCNVKTFRNGLLPDKYGKDRMPAVTGETYDLIKEAQRGKVFSSKLSRGD
jgi:MoaA/NifB/PqqE/SkfB family radical SAM enzyme